MSSPWTECTISSSLYEGPHTTAEGAYKLIIVATLEPGAEKYFSGFRVLIGCNDTEEKLAALVRAIPHTCTACGENVNHFNSDFIPSEN